MHSYSYHNRVFRGSEWNRDDGKGYNTRFKCKNSDLVCKLKKFKTGGYHMGNGGLLSFSINEDDGKGAPNPKPLAVGTTKLVPTKNKKYVGTYEGIKYYTGDNTYDKIEWEKPVKLELGKYYHLVMHQEQPEKGMVVLNGFYTHHPGTKEGSAPGGPYYGRRFSAQTRQSPNGPWKVRLNVFPDFKLHYNDGTIAGPGNDGVGGEYQRYPIQGQKMMRQVFTMDYNAQITGIWVRYNRLKGNGPLTIHVKESGGRVLSKVLSPASKVPNIYPTAVKGPVDWIYNKFTRPINFIEGRKYYVEFQSENDTTYQIQTEETYDYEGGKKLSKESVWRGPADRAEFSTSGADGFKAVPRSVKDLPILFTIRGKPEVVK